MNTATSSEGQGGRARRMVRLAAFGASLLAGGPGVSRAADLPTGPAILEELRSFNTLGSVLYVAAHPDDENTRVITYLARGRGYRTAYLSLTRGDGGQNLLGPELRELLGVARTQELLAARRLDGGRQYFTRAKDFGYSKDYRESLRIWDQQALLADMVRVIRAFRPDVILTRFSPQPGPTHGHHTAATVLAIEAFKLAGDVRAFPGQLGELRPWQPRRILQNVGLSGGAAAAAGSATSRVHLEITGTDPVLGESFVSIALRSRAMHKTQGFDVSPPTTAPGPSESFLLLGGEPATCDILDGVDTTWSRVPGGAEIGRLTEEAIAQFRVDDPAASVPALLAIRRRASALPADPLIDDRRQQLDRLIEACLGLQVETFVDHPEAVPGETLRMRHTARQRSGSPVRWTAVRYPSIQRALTDALELRANLTAVRDAVETLPATTPPSQPYWLRKEGTAGLFHVIDPSLIGRAENPPAFPIEYVFEVGGQTLVIPGEPVQAGGDPAHAAMRRRLEVIAPVSLRFASGVQLFAPGGARPVTVELTAARARAAGTVHLEAPTGWMITPVSQPFHLAGIGERARFTFTVTAPAQLATATLEASVEINGARFNNQRIELRYGHIPLQLLQPAATLKAVSLDLAIRGRQVGYLPGAGDDVAASLEQMGYAVTPLTGADLTPEKLRPLDAVVIGARAFNTRTDLAGRLPALFAYVEAGGNVIAQYNRGDGLAANWLAPFQIRISRDRVTDEGAPVTVLAADHPSVITPNRITSADFDGWVQERGLYFPDRWDDRFTAILASGDPGEPPLRGGLLVAQHGKGYFVYTALAWFRQLPEGVPGAYRLFANLVSLGK
jgi:LmbE family N-acetylglucosaminyl deacetylase